jgi:hypothetical protein
MRRTAPTIALTLFLVACSGEPAPSTRTAEPIASDTPAAGMDTPPPVESPTVSGPATCVVAQLEEEPRIPAVGETDHAVGSPDAEITFIEYADFQ